ncbi:Tetracycline resistance protein, class B [Aquicella siphonis]|uniref:Tetracycline resistance protein, class B n=1 Tax=Aquicella siphonis TaxID=254247 RepID=A0A5E4PFY4_9COXI|nr:MFS transporter [Aquicella siphonis]VVC75754.1 Tetracycline resistance protein, class B [Aquicella siphonis]
MEAIIKTGWKTQLNILWTGQTLLIAMLAMSLPYWPLYISQLGDFSPGEVRFYSAAIYIAPFFSSTFSSPLWGRLGDKYGYKPMVIRACLGLFITQTLILCFSNVYLIFTFRLLQGVLAGFIVAAQSWALAISPENERGATMGKLQSATAVGNLLGPLLGGVIATYGGYQSIFSSSSVICALVTIAFLTLLQNTYQNTNTVDARNENQFGTMLSCIKRHILNILLVIIAIQLARAMITPVFSLFVTEKLGGNDITVGVLYAATGLMIFLTAPSWGRYFDRLVSKGHSVHTTIAGLLFLCAALQSVQAYADSAIAIFMLRLLWGICLGALLPVLLRVLVDNTHTRDHGLFLGFGNSATKLGNLLGIIAGALIEAHFGYTTSFLMTALLYVMAGIVILLSAKSLKTAPEEKLIADQSS